MLVFRLVVFLFSFTFFSRVVLGNQALAPSCQGAAGSQSALVTEFLDGLLPKWDYGANGYPHLVFGAVSPETSVGPGHIKLTEGAQIDLVSPVTVGVRPQNNVGIARTVIQLPWISGARRKVQVKPAPKIANAKLSPILGVRLVEQFRDIDNQEPSYFGIKVSWITASLPSQGTTLGRRIINRVDLGIRTTNGEFLYKTVSVDPMNKNNLLISSLRPDLKGKDGLKVSHLFSEPIYEVDLYDGGRMVKVVTKSRVYIFQIADEFRSSDVTQWIDRGSSPLSEEHGIEMTATVQIVRDMGKPASEIKESDWPEDRKPL